MHDTVEFEKRGIPATVIITQAFRNACIFQFRSKGMAGHPYIELPHPISNMTEDEMRAATLREVDALVKQLVA
ncbi:MAG: hypothetical protein ING77_10870 [Rhodocyclaceae bacterium]|nr:hypothetical protein [Rhodocyclaceae bacterium]MCE2981604.1 hypothetical protein [Betaproteobacteria bacterium]MCA3075605.1 hypothetical protein [Rhodocyclaceae bacterium]MCA3089185.1 hypothetical protein [Rhodocyclaceae bacterium]MCA3092746.1 hypothetical protein [Rhodocyclaceae bacterium]